MKFMYLNCGFKLIVNYPCIFQRYLQIVARKVWET